MDMYQKREQRRKNKEIKNNEEKSFAKVSINWLMETYGSTHSNPCKISIFQN